MNLSDHSESIHKQLQQLKELSEELKRHSGDDWLRDLLGNWGITGWLQEIII